ncbi:B-cell receptor-associated protein 31-like-domain-containing protein [Phycomyces blakesleeanus]|uniref:Endoplasmic reticulum transmembrane protein n=1 Tax=Phycomyces blakesleeanus TaxID=4837 RepID=A0ABR3BB09_PHYBL
MPIYYSLTFGILLTEMIAFGILVTPLPTRWRRAMMKFASTSPVIANGLYGLKIVFAFIFVLFLDTLNRLHRIESEVSDEHKHDYNYEANLKAKRFYAQRNIYLTGFTLFLSLILERTSKLVLDMLKREEELDNAKKESAVTMKDQQRLIDLESTYTKQVNELTKEIKELKTKELDIETLKKQVEQQSVEYNRLSDERNEFEKKANLMTLETRKDI